MESLSPPTEDLAGTLPPTAARLCAAAKRILSERGFRDLTIDAVAREAGEYKASVAYYFGNKSGLLAAVADSVYPRDLCMATVAEAEKHPPGEERVRAQMVGLQRMADDRDSMRALWELLPHILRDEQLRSDLSAVYDWYRRLDVRMFGVDCDDCEELMYAGALVVAAVDGFALQACLDPEGFDLEKAFAVLQRLVTSYVDSLQHGGEAA